MPTARPWPAPRARRRPAACLPLCTTAPGGDPGVDARDRIGKGPWKNAEGAVVAKSVAGLHSESNTLDEHTAPTEKVAWSS
jgi:hypothetical protein